MKQSGILLVSFCANTKAQTYQANAPMRETNLSSSELPAQERSEQKRTVPARKTFFCHLTDGLFFPERENRPFSMILTAGNSCSGMESKMAIQSDRQLKAAAARLLTYKGTEQLAQTYRPVAG